MRRIHFLMILILGTMIHAQVQPTRALAQQPANGNAKTALPVTQVVFFSSGVGFFVREGQIDGRARVDLSFPVGDINDLLKSMVLQDLKGGSVGTVSYDSYDPVEKTLKSFALDLTRNPSLGELLNQARGEKVEVEWQAQVVKGSLVGVERQRQLVGKDQIIEVEVLNLSTSEGLRGLPLTQVQRVRFTNTFIDAELKRALEVLARSHDTQKRVVSLQFSGEGKRPVRVGYVVENPIWKTSYRLVLGQKDEAFLQGWAMVDNVTDEDWQNVNVRLIAGRPISFVMPLYEPLYVQRPVVELELFRGLKPPMYERAMPTESKLAQEGMRRQDMKAKGGFGAPRPAPPPAGAAPAAPAFDIKQSIAVAATAQEAGEFFQYSIKEPITLARQKSAMLPIVNQEVSGRRVSIYNPQVHAKHPLLGLKFKNTTDLHLMQGPITVFEGAGYAGDARIMDIQPKEEVFISYAMDLGVEVSSKGQTKPEELVAVKVIKGILYATSKLQEAKTYFVKNRTPQDRNLVIEHPVKTDWSLVVPGKPAEQSRDMYRFALTVPPGLAANQLVVEETARKTQVVLSTVDDQAIRFYLSSKVISPKVKEALEKAIVLKTKLGEALRDTVQSDKQIKELVETRSACAPTWNVSRPTPRRTSAI